MMPSGIGIFVRNAEQRYKLVHVDKESFVDAAAPIPVRKDDDDQHSFNYNFANQVTIKAYQQNGRFFISSQTPRSEKSFDTVIGGLTKLVEYLSQTLQIDTGKKEEFRPTVVPSGQPVETTDPYKQIMIQTEESKPVFLDLTKSYINRRAQADE